MFLLLSHEMVQIIIETVKAPIHSPMIESSIPIKRESPTPEATAIVQTGQTAKASFVKKKLTPKREKMKIIILFMFLNFINKSIYIDILIYILKPVKY